MGTNDFHYCGVLLDMTYGIELEDEELEEMGLIAWKLIGNRNTRLYRYSTCIGSDLSVTLPCNALDDNGCVEAVTASYEDWSYSTNYSNNGDNSTAYVENTIESEKYFISPYYTPGKFLKYELVGDKLYFAKNYGRINIVYKGILADEDGLPQLTDKEAIAISTYLAFTVKLKEGLITNNPDTIKFADRLKLLWMQLCDLARVTYLNLNDMNEILDIKGSWNRHSYGRSTKYRK